MMKEKKKKENRREEAPQTRKHSLKQQLAGGMLCICLIAASMPLEYYGFPALVAQAEDELAQRNVTDGYDEFDVDLDDGDDKGETPGDPDNVDGEDPDYPEEKEPGDTDGEDSEEKEPGTEEGEDPDNDPTKDPEEGGAGSTEGGTTDDPDKETDPSDPDTSGSGTPDTSNPDTPDSSGPETPDTSGNNPPDITVVIPPEGTGGEKDDTPDTNLPQTPGDNTPVTPGNSGSSDGADTGDAAYDVDFYSGRAGKKETISVSTGTVFPELEPLEGWEAVGWVTDSHGSSTTYKPGDLISYKSTYYYGIYQKAVTVSYKGSLDGAGDETVSKPMYAIVHSTDIGYRYAQFKAKSLTASSEYPDYTFLGWAEAADSAKATYTASQEISTGEDLTLYAIYAKMITVDFYSGADGAKIEEEAYVNVNGGQGVLLSAPALEGLDGWTPLGWTDSTAEYDTFIAPGKELPVSDGTNYYGLYEKEITLSYIDTDPNTPQTVKGSYRANVHGDITYRGAQFVLATLPDEGGYNFVGWNTSLDGTGTFYSKESAPRLTEDTVLYPQWEDQTAPVLGEAVYGPGYQGLFHWIIGKKGLSISIPVTEEGSGVKSAEYTLYPENGEARSETIQVTEAEDSAAESVRILRQYSGEKIQFTIDEDFKGYVIVTCTDNAGNVSAQKRLTAEGGVIVEDNAPTISFTSTSVRTSNGAAAIEVTVKDADGEQISGGLAGISYQVDENGQVNLPGDIFGSSILESHTFMVEISGEGRHILQVSAIDNAGNETTRRVNVSLTRPPEPDNGNTGNGTDGSGNTGNGNNGSGNTGNGNNGSGSNGTGGSGNSGSSGNGSTGTGSNGSGSGTGGSGSTGTGGSSNTGSGSSGSGNSGNGAPQTGDFPHMEIYATLGMIAGFSYLLLYFETGKNGMTEEKKDELVSRLIRWAQKGGFLQRIVALGAIFLLLTYYHSIGKCTDYRWRETLQEVSRR